MFLFYRDSILKLFWSQGIDSASLCSPVGSVRQPITTRFLASIDCSKIPAKIVPNPNKNFSYWSILSGGNFGQKFITTGFGNNFFIHRRIKLVFSQKQAKTCFSANIHKNWLKLADTMNNL